MSAPCLAVAGAPDAVSASVASSSDHAHQEVFQPFPEATKRQWTEATARGSRDGMGEGGVTNSLD